MTRSQVVLPSWWSVSRLVGTLEPIATLHRENYYDALAFAVAEFEIPPNQLIVLPFPKLLLPIVKRGPNKKRNPVDGG